MVATITNSGLANSSVIEPKETTIVVSGFGTGRTKDSKDKFTANGINNLKIVDSSNKIKQNGFSSFKVVPAIGTGSFDERFNVAFDGVSSTVIDALTAIQRDANNIKNTVISMSNNFTTNYLSKAELTSYDNIINITSAIKEQTATFVTTEMAGGWYGLTLESDVNGKKYITGFDMGSLVYPESGINDSYFRINADRFIVGGDIGDGEFGGPLDENGEPIPAFAIVQDGTGSPQMYFNGKVNIESIPQSVTKLIGKFAHISELNSYLAMHPEIVVRDGDSYLNTSENIMYFWDGDEWISAEGKLELRSFVFKRSKNKPIAPTGGTYSNPVPSGWSDGIPPAANTNTTAIDPVWVSMFVFDNKTDYTTLPPVWSEPEIMVDVPGESDLMFHNSLTTPPNPVYTGDETAIQQVDINNGWYNNSTTNAVWAAHRKKSSGVWTNWYVYRIKGETGAPGSDGANGANGANGRRGSLVGRGSSTGWPSGSTLTNLIRAISGSEDRVYAGDTVIWTNTSTSGGTEIYEYNGSTWGTNTALKVNGNAVISGTLYSDRIMAGHIGSAVTALARNIITATDTFANEDWTGGTTVGSISYTNHSSSYASILIIVTGRTGVNGEFAGGSCAFKIFNGTTQIFNYGWTPSGQDSKAFSTTVVMPPKSTRTFYVRAVKNASDASTYTLGASLQISIIGVSNGG